MLDAGMRANSLKVRAVQRYIYPCQPEGRPTHHGLIPFYLPWLPLGAGTLGMVPL